ncbi:MAG: universal stress protein [Gammaproteobacteria bacterium]|nr:universal stress protein [Gammaproteobacteria bacterium]
MGAGKRKKPILVPVDFSAHAAAALRKAAELAGCTGQRLLVLHVIHDPAEMPGYYGPVAKKKKLVRIEDLARDAFSDFLRKMRKDNPDLRPLHKCDELLVIGLPVTRILEVVERSGATMVVMGSQGRTGLDHLMLGSKAEQVVRLSPVPVLIVKAGQG